METRQEKDAYHLLDRPGQVVVARLRSGHNRLNTHMHRKLKFVSCPTSPCGEEDQTTEHVLQRCNIHQPERIAQWPSVTPLHHNLYGVWRTWRRPPTLSLLLDWSCRRTRRRRRRLPFLNSDYLSWKTSYQCVQCFFCHCYLVAQC